MLGKMWKHEWKANCRLLLAVHLALLVMGLVGYLIQGILQTGPVTSVIGGLYILLFFLLAAAAFLLTHILMIIRYYRNFLRQKDIWCTHCRWALGANSWPNVSTIWCGA